MKAKYVGPSPKRRTPFGVVKHGDVVDIPDEYRGMKMAERLKGSAVWEIVGEKATAKPKGGDG